MINDKLVPNIEQRIASWFAVQEQLRKEKPPSRNRP